MEPSTDQPVPTRSSRAGVPPQGTGSSRGSLLFRLSTQNALGRAFLGLKRKENSRGTDGVTFMEFEGHLRRNLSVIRQRLRAGDYRFSPLRPSPIPKKAGGYRPILVPTIGDRVVQRALLTAISRFVKAHIRAASSHAFHSGQNGVKTAVHYVASQLRAGATHVLVLDIKDFFSAIRTGSLLEEVGIALPDASCSKLLASLFAWEIGDLKSLPAAKRRCFPSTASGLPQGCLLSPLLSNFYMRQFDHDAEAAGLRIARYADDIAICCDTALEAEEAWRWTRSHLGPLNLAVHELGAKKCKIIDARTRDVEYLGCSVSVGPKGIHIQPSQGAIASTCEEIRAILSSGTSRTLADRYRRLEYLVNGWLASFGRVCDVAPARGLLGREVRESMERLLRARGLLPATKSLNKKQVALLGLRGLL